MKPKTPLILALLVTLSLMGTACESGDTQKSAENGSSQAQAEQPTDKPADNQGGQATADNQQADRQPWVPDDLKEGQAVATFAGGCFWCMEPPFDKIEGVQATIVGYTGGSEANPSYEQVARGATGHAEAIQVRYDPEKVGYETLLAVFWSNIDPTAVDRQFVDVGSQYRTGIFYHNDKQLKLAKKSRKAVVASGRFDEEIVTPIEPAPRFWRGEKYHQNYYKKKPASYKSYRRGSGRDEFIEKYWSDEPRSIEELRSP